MIWPSYFVWVIPLIIVFHDSAIINANAKSIINLENNVANLSVEKTQTYPPKVKQTSEQNCQIIRKAIETRNFIGWKGLPSTCTAKDLFNNIPKDLSDEPVRPLGSTFIDSTFVPLSLTGYYMPKVSFRDDQLILFDGIILNLAGDFDMLHKDLGEPSARLDSYDGILTISNGEWIYPERGITVFINIRGDKVRHVSLYRPTTLEEYKKTLRLHLQKRYRPLRKKFWQR